VNYQYQKKVSTWNYKVPSSLDCRHASSFGEGLLILLSRDTDEYGTAEFQPGMEEVEVPIVPTSTTTSITAPATATPVIATATPAIADPEAKSDDVAAEGFTIFGKGLFLAVILGCVVVYIRMNNRKGRRFPQRSAV